MQISHEIRYVTYQNESAGDHTAFAWTTTTIHRDPAVNSNYWDENKRREREARGTGRCLDGAN